MVWGLPGDCGPFSSRGHRHGRGPFVLWRGSGGCVWQEMAVLPPQVWGELGSVGVGLYLPPSPQPSLGEASA